MAANGELTVVKNICLFAVDIDGVILKDTFSPVLRMLIQRYGGHYTRDIERNVFSKNQYQAATYIIEKLGLEVEQDTLIASYFKLRDEYLSEADGGLVEGAEQMLERLSRYGVPMICYGGLELDQIHTDFNKCSQYFDKYICTNAFRPGMEEIIEMYNLTPKQVLFIDDVNTVAETCKSLGSPFIGVPPQHEWGWQDRDMVSTGVVYKLTSIKNLNAELINEIDENTNGCFTEIEAYA